MRKSLHLARRLSSYLCSDMRGVVPSSPASRAIYSVSAIGTFPTTNSIRGYHGESMRVQHEKNERRNAPLETRNASEEPLQDTLLSFPGSLSADEKGEQLFISDTDHHRIIVVDGNGKIIDCIGSTPGFEDGTFERARLCCPSSTVFDEHSDCLYIADSKNHVIRRADLSKRTIDTVCRNKDDSASPLWSRFSKWIQSVGLASSKDHKQQTEEDTDGARNDTALSDPSHLKLAADGSLVVASQGFQSLWVLDPISGECSRISCEGSEAVYEEYERRSNASKETADAFNLIHPAIKRKFSRTDSNSRPYSSTDMVSRVAKIHQNAYFIDTEGHIVRKMDLQTGSISTLQLSNFGPLGLPAWWSLQPLSLLSADRDSGSVAPSTLQEDKMVCHEIQVQPGRCLICIDPLLPEGMVLAAAVENSSVWRQARGSVVELSTFGGRLMSHKVSGAQQWVDDFEDLETESESFDELVGPRQSENRLPLYSFIDASLGSGEVQLDAVLYLKPAGPSTNAGSEESRTERKITDERISNSKAEKPAVQKDYATDQEDDLRLRHLHVRVRIEVTSTASSERTNLISVQL